LSYWIPLAAALLPAVPLAGQSSGVLSATAPAGAVLKRGGAASAKINVQLRGGYHVNSHSPNDEYLIPLRLRWDEGGPVKVLETTFPKPELRDYGFSDKPVSVFTGDFVIVMRLQAAADAPTGSGTLAGKLRYQACDANSCLPPRTIDVRLPYEIR
jgi:DsbC/DsbD-like thiol-disulfide interchange protein